MSKAYHTENKDAIRKRLKGQYAEKKKRGPKEGLTAKKECPDCKRALRGADYYSAPRNLDGLSTRCKECHNSRGREYGRVYRKRNRAKLTALEMKRTARKLSATPSWLSERQIKEIEGFYVLARKQTIETGIKHEVDHIIPLQGENVCGLHVPWNLQVITKAENVRKGNRVLKW
ncbi:MAG: HNH endonuclease signature motif containing protein [Candidatus Thorarchaeota archaeon]|jgi:5-methylcytosine-specific restriction endonuclease McrA